MKKFVSRQEMAVVMSTSLAKFVLALSLCAAVSGSAFGRPLFPHPATYLGKDSRPLHVLATDLNDDGHPDLVVTQNYSHAFAILLGNGDGTFAAPVHYPPVPYDLAYSIHPEVGDFNEDGRPDLAMGAGDYDTLSYGLVIFQGNGDGTFGDADWYPTSGWPNDVKVGDFNQDDNQDLVYVGTSGLDGTLRLGNGDGTFGGEVAIGASGEARSVAVADFDDDGFDDLAFSPGSGIDIMLGDGAGAFAFAGSFSAGDNPGWIAAGDLDGDDIPDLAVTNQDSHDLSVLLGNGDGTFDPEQRHSVLTSGGDSIPLFVAITDLDGDGLQDLAVSKFYYDSASLVLLFGTGGGQFAPAVVGDANRPWSAGALAMGDFDGDGIEDLARPSAWSQDVVWVLGKSDGTFITRPAHNPVGENPTSIVAGDLNADGRLDLITANWYTGDVSVLLANGAATFAPEMRSCIVPSVGPCTPTASLEIELGELTGDEHLDLAVPLGASDSISILAGDGAGNFSVASEIVLHSGTNPKSVALGDLDGDELLDLVVVGDDSLKLGVFLADGNGSFTQISPQNSVGPYPRDVVLARFNDDASLDVAVVDQFVESVTVLLGVGNGSFTVAPTLATDRGDHWEIAAGQLNGDQFADLAVASTLGGISVFLSNGDGTFGPATILPVAGGELWTGAISIVDLDGDGHSDLVGGTSPEIVVFPGNGDGTFGPEQGYAGSYPFAVGDFDLDSRLDVAARLWRGNVGPGTTPPPDAVTVLLNQSGPAALTLLGDHETLTWPAVVGAFSYDVYRGEIAALVDGNDDGLPDSGFGACITTLDDDSRDTLFIDRDLPDSGAGFFYLMSVIDAQGNGGLGSTSTGLPRLPEVACP